MNASPPQLIKDMARLEQVQEGKERRRRGLLAQIAGGGEDSATDSDSDTDDENAIEKVTLALTLT